MTTNKLIIPIGNFDKQNTSVLELGNTKILPISEISKSFNSDFHGAKYFIETNEIENEEPRRTLDRVLIQFKLFKDSIVLSNIVYIGKGKQDILPHYTHWIDQDRGLPPYFLSIEEEKNFINFWKKYFTIDINNFAINRFHLADFRAYSTDRFVDYVESLEYLFVPDSGEGEISYKFRSRGCLILGNNLLKDRKIQIFEELKDAYNLRSAIVHGSNYNKYLKNCSWENKIKPVRNYAREAIKLFVQNNSINNNEKRRKYLEEKLIFEAYIQNL